MFRSPRAVALRVTAVVVAGLTARTVALDLRSIHAQAHALGPLHAVVVARHTLSKGDLITRDDVAVVRRHRSQEPADALGDTGQAVHHVVAIDVAGGAPVLAANVARAGNGTSAALGTNERVVRIVDAGGLVPEVGAIVDVYATFDSADPHNGTQAGTAAQLVARGARVLRVDRQSSDVPTAHGATTSNGVLVMVKASETPEVASAVANGVVTIAIAPTEDACCVDR